MQRLTEWLTPNATDLSKCSYLETLLRSGKTDELISYCKQNCILDELVKICEMNPSLNDFFRKPEQAGLWLFYLKIFDIPQMKFQTSYYPPISVADTLKGRFFYALAANNRKATGLFSEDHIAYLKKSAQYHCVYAINGLISYAIARLNQKDPESQLISAQMLHLAKEAIKHHWTVGFLLSSKVNVSLARHFNDSVYFMQALEDLLIAQRLSQLTLSQQAIYNATYGEQELSAYGFSDWDKQKATIIHDGKLKTDEIFSVFRNAQNRFEALQKQHEALIATQSNRSLSI